MTSDLTERTHNFFTAFLEQLYTEERPQESQTIRSFAELYISNGKMLDILTNSDF